MAAAKRFAQTTDDEINEKKMKLNADNTIRANNKCAKILKDYLKEKNQDESFELYDEVRLNEILSHFYMDLRKPDGQRYKSSSFESVRNGLNRYLKSPPYNKKFDIVKDPSFSEANINFRAVMVELKKLGLGNVEHHPVINEADRWKLYSSLHMSPETPCGLANKVQFDIRLYFFRRGQENMNKMSKTTFLVKDDPKTGLKFVTKNADEMTKNHRENDKENYSGIMPESPGSPYCPVRSFEKYMSVLHPKNDRLWQRPLDTFSDASEIWYANVPIGDKKIGAFMSNLSKQCGLSQIYTNHSIRATGATILSKNMYGAAQIMAVTGHKSVQSLTTYQRVDNDDKIKMGQTITNSVVPNLVQEALPTTSRPALLSRDINSCVQNDTIVQDLIPVQSNSNVIRSNTSNPTLNSNQSNSVHDYLEGLDLGDILGDFGNPNFHNTMTSNNLQSNPRVFYGNVTIIHNLTINKS